MVFSNKGSVKNSEKGKGEELKTPPKYGHHLWMYRKDINCIIKYEYRDTLKFDRVIHIDSDENENTSFAYDL